LDRGHDEFSQDEAWKVFWALPGAVGPYMGGAPFAMVRARLYGASRGGTLRAPLAMVRARLYGASRGGTLRAGLQRRGNSLLFFHAPEP
jgi:hypothetical protein